MTYVYVLTLIFLAVPSGWPLMATQHHAGAYPTEQRCLAAAMKAGEAGTTAIRVMRWGNWQVAAKCQRVKRQAAQHIIVERLT